MMPAGNAVTKSVSRTPRLITDPSSKGSRVNRRAPHSRRVFQTEAGPIEVRLCSDIPYTSSVLPTDPSGDVDFLIEGPALDE